MNINELNSESLQCATAISDNSYLDTITDLEMQCTILAWMTLIFDEENISRVPPVERHTEVGFEIQKGLWFI